MKTNNAKVAVRLVYIQGKRWALALIDQFGVEYVKAISLDDLRRRIVQTVVGLVVWIPVVSLLHRVVENRLLWRPFILPGIQLMRQLNISLQDFFVLVQHLIGGLISTTLELLH